MKKKGKKEKKVRKKTFISEFETINFEQQILDNNRQLARLRIHNEELEAEAEKLREKLTLLEENRADLISHLQQVLQKKTEEAQELQEKLHALDKLCREERAIYKKKEGEMEQEYKTMENNLTAEIKLAAGKLNALEDWRLARIDLMKKFEEQEQQMAEQEIRHKEILYETEKKFIVGKTKMQVELEKRLVELAESFREATGVRMAEATQRVVRENVALQQELNALLESCSALDAQVQQGEERERELRLNAELYEAEAKLALGKVLRQQKTIERLAMEHRSMMKKATQSERALVYAQRGEAAAKVAQADCERSRQQLRILEQNIQQTRETGRQVIDSAGDDQRETRRLTDILARARNAVRDALLVKAEIAERGDEEEGEDVCSTCFLDVKEQLLHSLQDILGGYQLSEVDSSTVCETEVVQDLYEFGNLGLIPAPQGAKSQDAKPSSSKGGTSQGTARTPTLEQSSSLSRCSCEI